MEKLNLPAPALLAIMAFGLCLCCGCGNGNDDAANGMFLLTYTSTAESGEMQSQLTVTPDGQYRLTSGQQPAAEGQLPPEFWEQLRIWKTEVPSFTYDAAPQSANALRHTLTWRSGISGTAEDQRMASMLEWTGEMFDDLAGQTAEEPENDAG